MQFSMAQLFLARIAVRSSSPAGKRPEGEIQDVVAFPAQTYSQGEYVQCTYIQISQVEYTYGVILSKPNGYGEPRWEP